MVILDSMFLEEIDLLKEKIDKRKLNSLVTRLFEDLSNKTILNASIQDGDNAKRKDEVIFNFKMAWNYTMARPYCEFDILKLEHIAGLVEPVLKAVGKDYASIRKGEGTTIPGIGYMPPVDEFRIRAHLDRMNQTLKSEDFHPVEEAIFLYFNLIRLQPFSNGNKRIANIVMNEVLLNEGFAPISIPVHQSGAFNGYLEGAIRGFKLDGSDSSDFLKPYLQPGKEQKSLYDYLGRIEKNNLVQIEDYLAGLPQTTLKFKCKDPAPLYSLKKKVVCWCTRNNLPSQISLDASARTLDLVGDVPLTIIDKLVDGSRLIRSYEIVSNGEKEIMKQNQQSPYRGNLGIQYKP